MNTHSIKLALGTATCAAALALAPAAGAAPVKSLAITAPPSVEAGAAAQVTVTALSKRGKAVRKFKGKVKLTSTDPAAQLPAAYRFTRADKGRHAFSGLVLNGAGTQTLTASAGRKARGSKTITVGALSQVDQPGGEGPGDEPLPGPADPGPSDPGPVDPGPTDPGPAPLASIELTSPGSVPAGQTFSPTASGYDAAGNSLGDVTEATTFSITPDGSCSASTCMATKSGAHTLTATNGGVTKQATVQIKAGAPVNLQIGAPANVDAGQSFRPTASATDGFGNSLGDVTAQATFTFGGSCGGGACSSTVAGAREVVGSLGGRSASRTVAVRPGPVASLVVSGNGTSALAPAPPVAGADTATYQALAAPTRTFTAAGRDAYGNGTGDVTSQASFSIAGRPCSGNVCGGGAPGTETVTGKLGSATGTANVTFGSYEASYRMVCKGENYDVDDSVDDGCEWAQPNSGHSTAATAIDLGRKSCFDGDSDTTVTGTVLSDKRAHSDVGGWNTTTGSAGVNYTVYGTGGTFCQNDMRVEVTTTGGNDDEVDCYRVRVHTDMGYTDYVDLDGSDFHGFQTESRYYPTNSPITISIYRTCNAAPAAVDYSIKFHL